MPNPQIEVFGLVISEPMTMATDYLIALLAWWCGARILASASDNNNRSRQAWGLSFLITGFGALLGGTSHGFATYLNDTAMNLTWKGATYSIGFSMLFALAGTIRGAKISRPVRQLFNALAVLGFVIYAFWIMTNDSFLSVIIYYLSAMVFIAALQIRALFGYQPASAKWLLTGVVVTLVGAYIQQSGIDLHRNFNHNDLYHIVQMAGLYLLYRGAALLGDDNNDFRQKLGLA
jgi:hypothetical protein